jgi:hypothetical protein
MPLIKPDADHLTGDQWTQHIAMTYCGMAYFAGTGPSGKTCADCIHRRIEGRSRKKIACDLGSGATFPKDAHACKYFEGGE